MRKNVPYVLVLMLAMMELASTRQAAGAGQLVPTAVGVAAADATSLGDSVKLTSEAVTPAQSLPWQQEAPSSPAGQPISRVGCSNPPGECVQFSCNCMATCGSCGIQTLTCNVPAPRISWQCICNSPC
jgi:hypothetical protein